MFNRKWNQWHDSLPVHTRTQLANQPLWHDVDLAKAFLVGFILGVVVALIF